MAQVKSHIIFLNNFFKGMDCPACEVTNHNSFKEITGSFGIAVFSSSPNEFALTSKIIFGPWQRNPTLGRQINWTLTAIKNQVHV